ncbi:MAG: ThuA domain-containing protein [Planctomycetaceae bacterium]|jgi:type 1 glutamine amidotransferase|nr:ThuA domain-containing protein [Planctomycetaceae bacterium]
MKRREFLSAGAIGLAALTTPAMAQPSRNSSQPRTKPAKVLHFTRSQGFEHDPAKRLEDGTTLSGRALKAYFADKQIELVETQDGNLFDGDLEQYDGFIFYTSGGLLSTDGSKNDYSKPMTSAGLRKMIDAIRSGKGLVGIHSATDSHCGIDEDGVDAYTKLIGARFTGHGDQQFATLTIVEPTTFPFLKESGKRITTWEEWYTMNQFNKDLHILLVQETKEMTGKDYARPPFPASWIRKEEQGRVAYASFGHDNRYFQNVENVRRIGELVEWSVGRFQADTTPNLDKVTPKANEMPK